MTATITVTGRAERRVLPSRAEVHARLSATGRDRAAAHADLVSAQERVRGALELPAVFEQVRTWASTERRREHHATVMLRVDVEDPSDVGGVVDDLVTGGADVSWIDWQVAPDDPIHAEVRRAAVAQAQSAARDYAAALDRTLGEVRSVTDGTSEVPVVQPAARAMLARGGDATPEIDLEPPTIRVAAQAVLTHDLVDA